MISLVCPTRGRREWLERMYHSALETSVGRVEVIAVRDRDDDSYHGLDLPFLRFVTAPEGTVFSDLWNIGYYASRGDIIQMAADDEVFRTPGWDATVTHAFPPDLIAFVFGNDGSHHDGVFGTLGFVSRRWCQIVGRFVPPYFASDWVDNWLNDIALDLDRHIHVPILTEHLHFTWGKAPFDETYARNRERYAATNPPAVYAAHATERTAETELLRGAMW